MPADKFESMTWRSLAAYFDVSKSTLHDKANTKESNGKDWLDQRAEIQKSLAPHNSVVPVDTIVFEGSDLEKKDFITKTKRIIYILYDKIIKYIDTDTFEIESKTDVRQFLKIFTEISANYAKLRQYVDTGRKSGVGKQDSTNVTLNVPVKYITAEGREWLKRKLENPISMIGSEDAEYEEVDD